MQRKITLQYYILSGLLSFCGLSFVSAVYASFLMKNGLNLMEINLVNAVFYLTLFACEIPTGAFADIFGRKTSFVLACFMLGLAKFIYGFTHSLVGFVAAEIVAGVGYTFYNGAFQAWFVDSMKHGGYDGDLRRFFGKQLLISQICAACGAVVGGYLFTIDISLPWIIGSVFMLALTLYTQFTMREEYFTQGIFTWRGGLAHMRDITVKSIRYGVDHASVRFVLIITFVQILASQALNMYWQPFFVGRGMPEKYLGSTFFAMMMFLAVGGYIASKLKEFADERIAIVVSQIVSGACIVGAACMPNLAPALMMFMLHEVPRGIFAPLKDAYLQKLIPSAERATISSFCAIAPHIGGAIGLLMSGSIAQALGINSAWIVSGSIFVIGSLLVMGKRRK